MKHHYMAWLVSITLTSRLVFKLVFHLEFDSSHLRIGWQVIVYGRWLYNFWGKFYKIL